MGATAAPQDKMAAPRRGVVLVLFLHPQSVLSLDSSTLYLDANIEVGQVAEFAH
jgi:hypothetical protein